MANELRVTLEVGPKDEKVVAVAPDWPGWSAARRPAKRTEPRRFGRSIPRANWRGPGRWGT